MNTYLCVGELLQVHFRPIAKVQALREESERGNEFTTEKITCSTDLYTITISIDIYIKYKRKIFENILYKHFREDKKLNEFFYELKLKNYKLIYV